MTETIRKNDYFILVSCLLLGILVEITFFQVPIGVSLLLFISCFYVVFFIRFRLSAFHHRRIGLLLMVIIWLLSATYLLFGETFFYGANKIIIPVLMFIHVIVVTRPNTFVWGTTKFGRTIIEKLIEAIQYDIRLLQRLFSFLRQKHLLLITIILIISFVGMVLYMDMLIPFIRVCFISMFIFGILQVLRYQKVDEQQYLVAFQKKPLLSAKQILYITNGLSMIGLILLLTLELPIVQQYYVTYIWTICSLFYFYLVLGKGFAGGLWHKLSYVGLIIIHSLFLYKTMQISIDVFQDNWTIQRFIAFISLFYIFFLLFYTAIRVWASRISLTHFYVIIGVVFYTMLNMIQVEQFVVNQYDETNIKENESLLQSLSYAGAYRMMEVYDAGDKDDVDQYLAEQFEQEKNKTNILSYNFSRAKFLEMYRDWSNEKRTEEEAR